MTGCLKMEAVCLTGNDVFKSGLPWIISNTNNFIGRWFLEGNEKRASRSAASAPHLVLVVVVIPQSLTVLVQFAHEHLPRAEVEGAKVHLVAKVTCQLGLASKLLSRWTDK